MANDVRHDSSFQQAVKGKPLSDPDAALLTTQGTIGALMHELEAILHEYLSFNWDRMEEVNKANAHLQREAGLMCPWRPSRSSDGSQVRQAMLPLGIRATHPGMGSETSEIGGVHCAMYRACKQASKVSVDNSCLSFTIELSCSSGGSQMRPAILLPGVSTFSLCQPILRVLGHCEEALTAVRQDKPCYHQAMEPYKQPCKVFCSHRARPQEGTFQVARALASIHTKMTHALQSNHANKQLGLLPDMASIASSCLCEVQHVCHPDLSLACSANSSWWICSTAPPVPPSA